MFIVLGGALHVVRLPCGRRAVGISDENFAWIDFFWSTMGRSGDVGRDIGLLYDKLQDKHQLDKLIGNFATSLVEKQHQWKWLEAIEAKGLTWLLELIFGKAATHDDNHGALLRRVVESLNVEGRSGQCSGLSAGDVCS